MAIELEVVGLMNVQFAVKDDRLFVLEVNPRASRTIPFVSKATGVPLAKLATKVMLGRTLKELGFEETKRILKESITSLPEKEKLVIALYHYEELTLKEIGEVLSISESRVSQIHSKAIIKLRSRLLKRINE